MINWVNIAVLIPFLILIGVICLVVGFWHDFKDLTVIQKNWYYLVCNWIHRSGCVKPGSENFPLKGLVLVVIQKSHLRSYYEGIFLDGYNFWNPNGIRNGNKRNIRWINQQ